MAKTNQNASGDLFAAPRQDFLASIVVFLVALPLCMGIAIASGVPVAAGLITGIVGGLIVGWFSGAPLQVSGPAAGLTVIVYDLVQEHGLEVFGIAVLIGGALQFVAGVMRYGRWFRAVSPAVIHGMLAGIGILILSSQFHVMVDDDPKGKGIVNLITIPNAIVKGLPIPELGTAEERVARRDALQQSGALHEEQVQNRERAAELMPVPVVPEDADIPAEPPAPPPVEDEALEPIIERQQNIAERLKNLIAELDEKEITPTVRDPEQLQEVTQESLETSQAALAALQEAEPAAVRATQAEMQQQLEAILGELKNHDWAAKVGLLTIITLVLWQIFVPAKLKLIPAPLVAIIVATAVTAILQLPVLYVEVPDNLFTEIHYPSLAVMRTADWGGILQAAIVLAAVASAETLLCATAVDQLQSETRTNYNQELTAQGIGNMICGALGALPMTGVIVRSSANVAAGAKTRLSTILHGLWLLVFVAALSFVLRMIPTAALAAMLVYIGYRLVNIKAIKDLRKYGWSEVAIYLVTVTMIVCTDLLTGVLTGIALSAAKLLYTFSHLETDLNIEPEGNKATLKLVGAATFIRLPVLAEVLEDVPGDTELHVDFQHLDYIDHACLDLLVNWGKQHESTGGSLVIDWDTLHANFHRENGNRPAAGVNSTATASSSAS